MRRSRRGEGTGGQFLGEPLDRRFGIYAVTQGWFMGQAGEVGDQTVIAARAHDIEQHGEVAVSLLAEAILQGGHRGRVETAHFLDLGGEGEAEDIAVSDVSEHGG